ncbi:M56 family metallopeptidase [Paenibacillus yanchengensis]
MSITASYVALAVIIIRLLLKRAPKIFSYLLWLVVAIRLLLPISFTSNLSILRLLQPKITTDTGYIEFIPQEIDMFKNPILDVGISQVSRFFSTSFPAATPMASTDLVKLMLWMGSIVWILGVIYLLLHSIISYLKVRANVRFATLVKDNIFEMDYISTPFVSGFFKPKIYIPIGINEREFSYILLHEQTHIRRRDYLIKPFAFILLIIHWFNPLIWLSYALMSKDMEMSCDEHVIDKMGNHIKGSYSTALLSLSINRNMFSTGSPLAFGESHVKARIKNILSYRQPSSWMVVGYMFVIAVLVIGCTANPKPLPQSLQQTSQSSYFGYNVEKFMDNKTLYVGNHTKVGGLVSGMPSPTGFEVTMLELQTKAQPYGAIIHYMISDDADTIIDETIDSEAFYRNSIMLLSLIDNVDYITFLIMENTGQYDGATYSITVKRDQVDKMFGEDVRHYASDETSMRQLIDRLYNVTATDSNIGEITEII